MHVVARPIHWYLRYRRFVSDQRNLVIARTLRCIAAIINRDMKLKQIPCKRCSRYIVSARTCYKLAAARCRVAMLKIWKDSSHTRYRASIVHSSSSPSDDCERMSIRDDAPCITALSTFIIIYSFWDVYPLIRPPLRSWCALSGAPHAVSAVFSKLSMRDNLR